MSIYEAHTYLQGRGADAIGITGLTSRMVEFRDLVKTGAPLDLKNSDPFLQPRVSCGVRFFGRDVAIDVPANVMYGMVGYLFWADRWDSTALFLSAAAGAAQADLPAEEVALRLLDGDDWCYLTRLDPVCDSWAIWNGALAVEEYGSDITEAELTTFLGRKYNYLHVPSYDSCEDSSGEATQNGPCGSYLGNRL